MIEYVSAGVALISVLVAVYFGLRDHHLQRKYTALQQRLVEIEEIREQERNKTIKKAQLSACIEEYGRNNHRLFIVNEGNAEARNIHLKMDGETFEKHRAALRGEGEINCIGAHSSATKLLALSMGCAPPFDLEIFWDDDSGEQGNYRTTLTF